MENENIKKKISKLLALATSPNENEARVALLKAQELMARYKLETSDIVDHEKQTIKHINTGIMHGARHDPWAWNLASTIADNYCCSTYCSRWSGKQNSEICFVGFEDDAEICANVFKYAVESVYSVQKTIKKKYKDFTAKSVRMVLQGYGYGFASGLKAAYDEKRKENQEWGLVLVTPVEVKNELSGMAVRATRSSGGYNNEYGRGFSDGKSFDSTKRVSA